MLLAVLIPLVGIVLGYGVSKILIIPYLSQHQDDTTKAPSEQVASKDTSRQQPPKDEGTGDESQAVDAFQQVFDVEGIELYRIQVGAFSKQENALGLAEELNNKGMAATVDMENMYKVYTLYSFSRDAAMDRLEQVRRQYKDAHVSQIRYPSVRINYPDSSSKEVLILRDQLKECRDMLIDIMAGDVDGNDITGIIQEQKDRIGQFDEQISQTSWPSFMEKYIQQVTMVYAAMLESYTDYNEHTNIPGQISMELVNCYVRLLEALSLII